MAHKMNILDKLYQDFVLERINETDWQVGSNAPLVVEFDTTEVCDFACPGCISEDLVNNRTSFSSERLLAAAEEMAEAGVKAVVLIGGGEPLAHPSAGAFIEKLASHDIHVGITTNGSFIGKYMDVIANHASWTRVSMDAATEETFNALRPAKDGKSKFNDIIESMRTLSTRKKGKLGFSFLLRTEADGFGIKSNIHEIYDAGVLAKAIGCDYFEVKPSYSYAGGQNHELIKHSPERMEEAKRQIEKLEALEDEGFKIVKAITLEDSLNGVSRKQEKAYTQCPITQLRTLVCPSGVYVCPYWRGKENYVLGDMNEMTFGEMWRSEQRRRVTQGVDPSRVCGFHCLRDESNKALFELIEKGQSVNPLKEYDRFL